MIFLAILIGILPGFAWLFFYLKEDSHPEPKKLLLTAFIFGAISGLVALWVQTILNGLIRMDDWNHSSLFGVSIFALVEELCKFGAAYVVVKKSKFFDEPIDAMIYLVVASLGFATLENIGVAMSFFGTNVPEASFGDIFGAISIRFIGATLLHTLASGILGYYWAISIREFNRKSLILLGVMSATIIHAIFNILVIKTHAETFFYTVAFVTIVGFVALHDFEKLKGKPV
jgi:RsiW-degrading membrane proteinase PrsW (M82 family)